MILLVIGGLLLASLWVARVIGSSSALVFDWFGCHVNILAALFSFVLIADTLWACFFALELSFLFLGQL